MAVNNNNHNHGRVTKAGGRYTVNEKIRISGSVRVVIDGESFVCDMARARAVAEEAGLDMVLVSESGPVPVIKICDFNKFVYEQDKKEKSSRVPKRELKEIKITPCIGDEDLRVKAGKIIECLADGHKVKVVLWMRGRELSRRDFSEASFNRLLSAVGDAAVIEGGIRRDERRTSAMLRPSGKAAK